MNLIAIETSTAMLSVALWRDGRMLERSRLCLNGGSELIVPWVRELLAEGELAMAALDAIAFGRGPGGFTGLRLACSIAQGLAFGRSLPVLGVGSLEALALGCGEPFSYVCVDARMSEVYCAAYERVDDEIVERIPPTACIPEAVTIPPDTGWAGCGDGFAVHGPALTARLGGSVEVRHPDKFPAASAVVRLAARRLARGDGIDAGAAAPLYVRDKVALTTAERIARGGSR